MTCHTVLEYLSRRLHEQNKRSNCAFRSSASLTISGIARHDHSLNIQMYIQLLFPLTSLCRRRSQSYMILMLYVLSYNVHDWT